MSLTDLTAAELLAKLASGEATSAAITEAFLQRIESLAEQVGFLSAYLVAAIATGGLLSVYVWRVQQSMNKGLVMAGVLFQPLRGATWGRRAAPPLFGTLEILGQERVLARIERALAMLTTDAG
jgi:glutamyl/glutaminyl-tRNA synthetase